MTLCDYETAQRLGHSSYQGAPCQHGHTGERYTRSKACAPCERARDKRRLADDPETQAARKRAWRAKSREHLTQYEKARYAAYDKALEAMRRKAWKDANPHKRAIYRANELESDPEGYRIKRKVRKMRRRATCQGATVSVAQVRHIGALQGHACAYCGATHDLHLDHIQPLSLGGSNAGHNLQYLCAFHNVSKGATPDSVYRARHGIPALTPWDVRYGLLLILLDP